MLLHNALQDAVANRISLGLIAGSSATHTTKTHVGDELCELLFKAKFSGQL